jgi:hypothetical protein
MMFIKDGHPSAIEIEGNQDDIMDEDEEGMVKSKDHCVIKMKTRRALKFIRHAEAAVVKINIYVKDCTILVLE